MRNFILPQITSIKFRNCSDEKFGNIYKHYINMKFKLPIPLRVYMQRSYFPLTSLQFLVCSYNLSQTMQEPNFSSIYYANTISTVCLTAVFAEM